MPSAKKSKAKRNSNNTTGYHGVTTAAGQFIAQIFHQGHTIRIGKFRSAEKAARAYDEKAKELKGDKAKLNFPPKG